MKRWLFADVRSTVGALSTASLLLVACGPERATGDVVTIDARSDGAMDATGDLSSPDASGDVGREAAAPCPVSGVEVSGTILAPNGEDPIAGAVVYLARTRPTPQAAGVGCDRCELPPDVLAYSVSDAQGRWAFVRGVNESGSFFLVVQKGRFRRVVPFDVTACAARTVPPETTKLPGSRMEGEIPRILVASGATADQMDRPATGDWTYDDIARVLRRIGITEFDRSDPCRRAGNTTDITQVANCPFGGILANAATLNNYNVVVAGCGALGFNHSWQVLDHAPNRVIPMNVRDWLRRGGRLYTSDTAYGLLARSVPQVATFAGGTTLTMGRDPANVGFGASPPNGRMYTGSVPDVPLRTWLMDRGSLGAGGSINLTGFISPWVAIDTVPMTTRTVVDAEVEWFSSVPNMPMPAGRRPLTISADVTEGGGCGRIVFSSYEVDNRTASPTAPLTPQERVLEYMIFELGGCLQTPG
ncbi:MAG: hypothetical protein JNK05_17555 [Myxococcales bacterium]|nr:hypothetical protein [Myxococcales bacterium]